MLRIRQSSSSNSVQLYLIFEDLPKYEKIQKGKRIDLIINANLTNTEPIDFATDDKIVKFMTQADDNKTILTFFLRYEPQKVDVSASQENAIVADILLGNQFTKAYPELSTKLEGITIVTQQGTDYANPYIASPYAENWRSFFSKYEPQIQTSASIKYTLPPFPVISFLTDMERVELLPAELFELSAQELWDDMIPLIINLLNSATDKEAKKLLALTFGEVLLRSGNFDDAFKQLYLLKDNYTEEPLGIAASYLLSILRAKHEDPYIADYELRGLEQYIEESFLLSPYILLSQIETALTTGQYNRANDLLKIDTIAFPPYLSTIKELRQSDYWYTISNHIKAYVGYTLLKDQSVVEEHPYSLNGYCNTLYHQKKYKDAASCFQKLSATVSEKNDLSLIALKKAMAELRYKSAREMYVLFSAIEDAYPGTVAGFRAAIKKADIRYLSQPGWRKTSVKYYKAFAEKATDRKVSEEAALKEAIAYAELGDSTTSINLLLEFLRNYRTGELVSTAQALLIELLPGQLKQLLDSNNYIDALVLAKKNRELFQKNWVDINLLGMLAKAYHELTIFEEARKLYIYLLRTAEIEEREKYYLPLISILYNQGDNDLVEDYAAEYNYNYPQGNDTNNIYRYKLLALIQAEKFEQSLDMLSVFIPDKDDIKEIAGELYFRQNQYKDAVSVLSPLWIKDALPDLNSQFMLAESLYHTGNYDDSQTIFTQLKDEEKFFENASYRLAIIERTNGSEDNALKLFQQIVEKGKDPLWQKLAQRELSFNELKEKY